MSRSHESALQTTSSSKQAKLGRLIAVPVLATAVALTAGACSSGSKSPASARTEAAPRPTSDPAQTRLSPEQQRATARVRDLARTASLAVLAEMQRPNVGTRPYTYGSDEFLSNKAAIVSPGPDGMLGTHDDTATPGHEYTPEMLARYYAKARKLYITSTGGVPQGGQETFSSVGVMYEVGQDSPLTQQSGLLGASDVERAVQSGAGLTVEAMSTSNRWTFNDQTKQAVGEDSGIVFESGKVYRGDNATAILATDPNWQPLSYDQITAPNITTVVVDTLESQMAHALFDLNYLSENTLPPHLTIVPPTLPTPASEIQVAPAAPYYPK